MIKITPSVQEFTFCFQLIQTVSETSPSVVHNLYFYVIFYVFFLICGRLLSITNILTYRKFQIRSKTRPKSTYILQTIEGELSETVWNEWVPKVGSIQYIYI